MSVDKSKKIRTIANSIFRRNGNGDAMSNWLDAEKIYYNKLKKFWWYVCENSGALIALVAIASLALNVGLTTWSININRTSTDISNRPYVSVDIEYPYVKVAGVDTAYGNNIIILNKGKISASNIKTEYYITSDVDKTNHEGTRWFEDNFGGRGATAFITPNSLQVEPGLRSLSLDAKFYYFEALISYEGFEKGKRYWTHVRKIYFRDKNTNKLYPVDMYGEWDRNKNFKVPMLSTEEKVSNSIEIFKSKVKNK
ncbi:MAG: hypothetical protein WC738_04495 [Candidatus Omnitrophota bacterium]|jgi:hypothetical protein